MIDAAYDSEAIRVISEALTGALRDVEGRTECGFGRTEKSGVSARIAHRLLEAYDSGERNPEILRRLALTAIKDPVAWWRGSCGFYSH